MEGNENNNVSMGQLLINFFAQVQKQGLVITLLVIAVVFSVKQNADFQGKVDACMQMRVEDGKSDRVEFLQVMSEVREALKENTRALRRKSDD